MQRGVTTFRAGVEERAFAYTVAATDNVLCISLEDSITKEQWASLPLKIADFVTSESVIPRADVHVYAQRILECLNGPVSDRLLSPPARDGARILAVHCALNVGTYSTPLEYKFPLKVSYRPDPSERIKALEHENRELKKQLHRLSVAAQRSATTVYSNPNLPMAVPSSSEKTEYSKHNSNPPTVEWRASPVNRSWAPAGVCAGIDFGSRESCIGVWSRGRVEIVTSSVGRRTTPSWVAFTDTEVLVGDEAKKQVESNPCNTVYDFKLLLGRKFSDPVVQAGIKRWPFQVLCGENDTPQISVHSNGEMKIFTPEELVAILLKKLLKMAELHFGKSFPDAVIAVPAYFNEKQREAMLTAGRLAGLMSIRLYHEPAVVPFATPFVGGDGEHNVVVVDLGASALNAAMMRCESGIVESIAVAGDVTVGGTAFDRRLVDHLAAEVKRLHQVDIRDNWQAMERLRMVAEFAKESLSENTVVPIEVKGIVAGVDFHIELTRAQLERVCEDLFKKIGDTIQRVLAGSKVTPAKVTAAVLVGGSSRIPRLAVLVSQLCNGVQPQMIRRPEEAVASGAATYGAAISTSNDRDMLLLDVTSHALMIELSGGDLLPVVPANGTLPIKKSVVVTTGTDNQSSMLIRVWEADGQDGRANTFHGEFAVNGIPPKPRGEPRIQVSVDVSDYSGVGASALILGEPRRVKQKVKRH